MEKRFRPVQSWCEDHRYGAIESIQSVSGGCINDGAVVLTAEGNSFFVKTNPSAPPDMFPREAEGLRALNVDDGPKVPRVFHADDHFIILENLNPASRKPDYWPQFGRQLAHLHQQTNDRFGFPHDNYIGSTPQVNTWEESGYEFFAQHRLIYQAHLARDRDRISRGDVRKVERIAGRLEDLVPRQDPSLIHGDLWSGNALTDHRGNPALIDPAAHYGWREAELAMTALFGRFSSSFYRAYEEIFALESGYEDRYPVYNLYHLLNHVNIFGGGYLSQVRSILSKYT